MKKKTMIVGALFALAASVSLAEVESQNVVGYNDGNITGGNYNAVGISWIGTVTSGFQLDSLDGNGLYGSTDPFSADQIQIWNPQTSSYEKWYYYVDESDHSWDGWWDMLTQMKTFAEVHPDGLTSGSSVWYLSSAESTGGSSTVCGSVDPATTVTLTLAKGNFNQFANPYPTGLQLDNKDQVDWTNAFGSTDPFSADQIQIWNPQTSSYEKWYYYVDEADHTWDGWWDLLTQMKTFAEVHPNGLEVGVPVWYLAAGTFGETFDVTFKTPVKAE